MASATSTVRSTSFSHHYKVAHQGERCVGGLFSLDILHQFNIGQPRLKTPKMPMLCRGSAQKITSYIKERKRSFIAEIIAVSNLLSWFGVAVAPYDTEAHVSTKLSER